MRQCAPQQLPILYRALLNTTALILFTTASIAVADTWKQSGRVIDELGEPLAGASVVTDIQTIGAVTDPHGKFTLSGDAATPERLTVSHVGYRPLLIDLASLDTDSELTLTLERIVIQEQGITVYANRARTGETPIAYSDITADEIERDYTVGDLPLALSSAPNVHIWTDAGSQLGYSHIAIRGFDERRISTYVNGVPLNDPEDHVTYFVDLPDFTNNVRDIQIQRGVGASLYADGAFGGSINIVSYALDQPRRFRFSTGIGEYWDRFSSDWVGQTTRQTLEFSSGLIEGRYHLLARLSRQSTGGYVNNSWARGRSYFLSASRLDPKSTTTFNAYGGPIRTHAAWDGIDLDTYRADRRTNFLTYANEGDNFNQPHYQLHNSYQLSERAHLSSTLYYIRGVGYFEQFKTGRDPIEFNVPDSLLNDPLTTEVDVTVRQWVTKNQLGINERLEVTHDRGTHALGMSGYYFDSDHWGEVIGALNVVSGYLPGERYYEYFGKKWNFSLFADERYRLTDRLNAQLSLQLRHLRYEFNQTLIGAFAVGPQNSFTLDWTFLSPRIGLNYQLAHRHSVFGSFSLASRTPRDVDIYDANDPFAEPDFDVKSERLYDYEFGYQYRGEKFSAGLNLFYMQFNNEVIFFGVDDDGSRLTDNAERSYHAGVELSSALQAHERLRVETNFSYNHNRYQDYKSFAPYYDAAGAVAVDFSDNVIPNFPEVIGNLIVDYQAERYRLTYRFRGVGRQYVESANIDSLAIAGFGSSSVSGSVDVLSN